MRAVHNETRASGPTAGPHAQESGLWVHLMYEAYYGLREKPFSILPDPDLIYWGRAHRMAFSMLEFGV